MKHLILFIFIVILHLSALSAQSNGKFPLLQTESSHLKADKIELSLQDASRNDHWLGRSPHHLAWAPSSEKLYFQWNQNPLKHPNPDLDPWFQLNVKTNKVNQVPEKEVQFIPSAQLNWDAKSQRATWIKNNTLYLYQDGVTKSLVHFQTALRQAKFHGEEIHFTTQNGLFSYHTPTGSLKQIAHFTKASTAKESPKLAWLKQQQSDLFEGIREKASAKDIQEEHNKRISPPSSSPIPIPTNWQVLNIEQSPNGKYFVCKLTDNSLRKEATYYMDYADESGVAKALPARAKVGAKYNQYRLQISNSKQPENSKTVDFSSITEDPVVMHGPYWSPTGEKALIQFSSIYHKDRWIAQLDLESGQLKLLFHDHDEAWIGGPPVVGYYSLSPTLLRWINEEAYVFASEKSGFAHLYLGDLNGENRPITEGAWEVRQANLSRDRQSWLITGSKGDPCQDHLFRLPAAGGQLIQLTQKEGQHNGTLSPDGKMMAILYGNSVEMPDLFLKNMSNSSLQRITQSGTHNYYQTALVKPEIVSFKHRDGKPVWAALFKPTKPHPKRPAILHIHGGGYRQFSHKGWSVYGYAKHLAMINYLVQEGYTVLDLDYRGSAGFGRDYRTDIYRSMGIKDVESGLAGINYLVAEHDIDPARIGVYGISYGGFFTLMALFKHPGKFAAGIANAAVADWAHYNYLWTSRILNLPVDDPEAYQVSSPINHATGLEDPLLIVHGIIDDNVHFQDAVRVSQKLIELEKDFEVMYYPQERHVIENEAARLDYHKRLIDFFKRNLLK